MKKISNVLYSEKDEGNKLDLYLPDGEAFNTIVYFHGGGLEGGDKADRAYVEMAEKFADRGYGFASANYRLYGRGGRYPNYLEDCAEAAAYVKRNVRTGKLLIAGQSAGAWIALMLCLNEEFLKGVGMAREEVDGWIIDSAQTTSHFNVLKYEEGLDPRLQRIDKYAPLYYVNENSVPKKMLIDFYENDMPCRAEQNLFFIRALKEFEPEADIEYVKLSGQHCYGSSYKDGDGEYAFQKAVFKWLRDKGF